MSLRNHIVLPVLFSALAVLGGCGGSGNSFTNPIPPPSGSFSNSNLNGTYVFSVSGVDVNGAPYSLLGTVTANGQGGISSGAVDINDAALSAPVPNQALGSGNSYSVSVDGRGRATLNTSVLGTITLDFVLQDSTHGYVTEFDGNATGSGTLDLQSAGVTPVGSYAFSFAGAEYSNGTTANTFASVGNFTIGSGGVISGLVDFNDASFAYTGQTLTGTLAAGPSSTPSTTLSAQFPTNTFGVPLTFDVIPIDASHLKFIEMDTFANLSGDAYTASSSFPSGTLAFTLVGSYPSSNNFSAAGGFMVTDGAGNITTASSADFNNNGSASASPLGFSGTYNGAGTGRFTISLPGFGAGSSYVAYPYSNGLLLLEIDNSGIMVGGAYKQSQVAFSESDGYGLNFSGVFLGSSFNGISSEEVDDIAEFATNSSGTTVTGIVDENFQPQGGPTYALALNGNYSLPDANGRGFIGANAGNNSVSTLLGGFSINFYSVDGTTFPFIEMDSGQVAAGAFFKQTPSAASAAAAKPSAMRYPFVAHPMAKPGAAIHKQK